MNERIDKLAEQCYVKTGSVHTDHFAYWKFAELIVKECIEIADHSNVTGKSIVGQRIKEHFGVEE